MRREPHMTLEREFKINGIPVTATVRVYVEEDYDSDPLDQDFENEKQRAAYAARFDGNDLFNAVVIVEASACGETATDALGGVHMHCNNMFNSKPFETDLKRCLKDHGMVNEALNHLKDAIEGRANSLIQYATVKP